MVHVDEGSGLDLVAVIRFFAVAEGDEVHGAFVAVVAVHLGESGAAEFFQVRY